jgi:peptidylprolyl isomerase
MNFLATKVRWGFSRPSLLGLLLVASALMAAGCGGGEKKMPAWRAALWREEAAARRRPKPPPGWLSMTKAERNGLPVLAVPRQSGPPPKHLVVVNLRKGRGRPVTKKDQITVKFFDVKYGQALHGPKTGSDGPTEFGMNSVIKGWELGLPGMRVGGRRELIVPPKLGYRTMTLVYVIDLLAVKPGGAGRF